MHLKMCFVIPVLFSFLFFTCKKETNTGVTSNETQQTNDPIGYYGDIHFHKDITLGQNPPYVAIKTVDANFYSVPSNGNTFSYVDVGTVSMNGTVLSKSDKTYYDPTLTLHSLETFTLNASGIEKVQPFSLVYNGGNINYADTNQIPASIKSSVGLNLSLTNIINSDSVIVFLSGTKEISKRFHAKGITSVQLRVEPEELTPLLKPVPQETIIYMRVRLLKQEYVKANNDLNYRVSFSKTYSKYSVKLN